MGYASAEAVADHADHLASGETGAGIINAI